MQWRNIQYASTYRLYTDNVKAYKVIASESKQKYQ